MKKIKYLILGLLLSASAFGFEIPRYQEIMVKDEIVEIDMHRLLALTQMVESRGGKDPYHGRVAKTSFQYEMETAEHYVNLVPEFRSYIESELGRELKFGSEEDAPYIAYIIFMAKLQYHRGWLDKYYKYYKETGDIEWLVYKVYWNSVKGASTYKKWNQRIAEYHGIKEVRG